MRKDVQNAKQRARESTLTCRLPIQALLDLLETDKVFHRVRKGGDGKLLSLFIAPRASMLLAQNLISNTVLIMDSTYKTNKYQMPLLHVVGAAPTNKTVSFSFCFPSEESEGNHSWALLQLSDCLLTLFDPSNLVVFVDRELTLIHGTENAFPSASILICLRHTF